MFSSEQKFIINGDSKDALEQVITLAMKLEDVKTVESFYYDENGILVICDYMESELDDEIKYPFEPTTKVLVEQIYSYITTLKIESPELLIKLAGEEPDDDGDVVLGWEVFHPLWYGEHKIEPYGMNSFLAVKPCWIVYGK